MKSNVLAVVSAGAMLLASGCAALQEVPRPVVPVGIWADGTNVNGLALSLMPQEARVRKGAPVRLLITIRNQSAGKIILPDQPDLFVQWIYPDGKPDNFLEDPSTSSAAITLQPGAAKEFTRTVSTRFFDPLGVTEFRAYLRVNAATNEASESAIWSGQLPSNGAGVLVE